MDEVTVGIVSWYSGELITSLVDNLQERTRNSRLTFIVCDNTDGEDRELYDLLDGKCRIFPHRPDTSKIKKRRAAGSVAHGQGLNFLFLKIDTEYGLFLDPDCLVLTKGWDVVCKTALSGPFVAAVGTPHHSSKIIKYHDFPSPIFVFFRTEVFRTIEADWMPWTDSVAVNVWDQILRIIAVLGGCLGERVTGRAFYAGKAAAWMRRFLGNSSKDTGWKIPAKARKHGYSAKVFAPATATWQLDARCAEESAVIDLMNEFELYLWQGIPLVTHYWGFVHKAKGNVSETSPEWKALAWSVAEACASIDIGTLPATPSNSSALHL